MSRWMCAKVRGCLTRAHSFQNQWERLLKRKHTAIVLVLALSQERIVWCSPCPNGGRVYSKQFLYGITAPNGLASSSKLTTISNGETTTSVLEKSSNESDIDGEVYFSLEPTNLSTREAIFSKSLSASSNSFRVVISEASLFKAKAVPKSNYFCGHLCDEAGLETYEAEFSTTATKDFSGNRHEKDSLSLSCQDCTLKDSEIGLQFGVFSGVSSQKFTFENTLEQPLSLKLVISAGTSGTPAKHCLIHHCLLWTFYWKNSNQPEHRVRSWHIALTCPRRNHENSHCVEARHHLSARRFVFLSEKDVDKTGSPSRGTQIQGHSDFALRLSLGYLLCCTQCPLFRQVLTRHCIVFTNTIVTV